MNYFKLNIVTPESYQTFEEIFQLDARSSEGYFAVMAFHEPYVFAIIPGKMKLSLKNGSTIFLNISEAILVVESNFYTITADFCDNI